jgi:hypothetical protein
MSSILDITAGANLFDEEGHIVFAKNCPNDRIIRAISKGNPSVIPCEKSKRKNDSLSDAYGVDSWSGRGYFDLTQRSESTMNRRNIRTSASV